MSAVDFRRAFDVGVDQLAMLGVVVEHPTEPRPITLELGVGGLQLGVALDYSEAGQLFDTLSQAMGIVVASHGQGTAAAALAGLNAARRDTPTEPRS